MKKFKKKSMTFKQARERAGLTQKELAIAIGVTDRTISHWETERRVPNLSPAQTADLCDLLNCTVRELANMFES